MRQYCTGENCGNYLNILRKALSICKKQPFFEMFIKLQYNQRYKRRIYNKKVILQLIILIIKLPAHKTNYHNDYIQTVNIIFFIYIFGHCGDFILFG